MGGEVSKIYPTNQAFFLPKDRPNIKPNSDDEQNCLVSGTKNRRIEMRSTPLVFVDDNDTDRSPETPYNFPSDDAKEALFGGTNVYESFPGCNRDNLNCPCTGEWTLSGGSSVSGNCKFSSGESPAEVISGKPGQVGRRRQCRRKNYSADKSFCCIRAALELNGSIGFNTDYNTDDLLEIFPYLGAIGAIPTAKEESKENELDDIKAKPKLFIELFLVGLGVGLGVGLKGIGRTAISLSPSEFAFQFINEIRQITLEPGDKDVQNGDGEFDPWRYIPSGSGGCGDIIYDPTDLTTIPCPLFDLQPQFTTCDPRIWDVSNLNTYWKTETGPNSCAFEIADYCIPPEGTVKLRFDPKSGEAQPPLVIESDELDAWFRGDLGDPANIYTYGIEELPDTIAPCETMIDNFFSNKIGADFSNNAAQINLIQRLNSNFWGHYSDGSSPDSELNPETRLFVRDTCNTTGFVGSCDAVLSQVCQTVTKESISNNLTAGTAPTLNNFCGCFMLPEQYTSFQEPGVDANQGAVCDSVCISDVNNVRLGVGQSQIGTAQICTQTVCIITDIDIQIIDSQTGPISFGQTCGSNCLDGNCNCYFGDITINVINSTVQGGINFEQNCGRCYEYTAVQPTVAQEVACDGSGAISSQSSNTMGFTEWVQENQNWLLPVLGVLFGLSLIAVIVAVLWKKPEKRKHKRQRKQTKTSGISDEDFDKLLNKLGNDKGSNLSVNDQTTSQGDAILLNIEKQSAALPPVREAVPSIFVHPTNYSAGI